MRSQDALIDTAKTWAKVTPRTGAPYDDLLRDAVAALEATEKGREP